MDRVEIKDVRLPQQLQRAMAAEAEATREARAKVIAAEGEQKSSKALKEAADIIAMSPAALQLRYLQVRPSLAQRKHRDVFYLQIFPDPEFYLCWEKLYDNIPSPHGDVQHLWRGEEEAGEHFRGLKQQSSPL